MDKLCVLACLFCCVCSKTQRMYRFVWKHSNREQTFFNKTSTASSREDCASLCHRKEDRCQSFQYIRITGLCSTHPVSFETSTWDFEARELSGNVLFYKQDSHGIGTRCSATVDCHVINSTCFQGTCLCEPGLSFNQANNTCVNGCAEYGTDSTVYPGLAIAGYNTRQFGAATLNECHRACVAETSFLCLTYDYGNSMCYLQNVAYLMVQPSERLMNHLVYVHGNRDCAP